MDAAEHTLYDEALKTATHILTEMRQAPSTIGADTKRTLHRDYAEALHAVVGILGHLANVDAWRKQNP